MRLSVQVRSKPVATLYREQDAYALMGTCRKPRPPTS